VFKLRSENGKYRFLIAGRPHDNNTASTSLLYGRKGPNCNYLTRLTFFVDLEGPSLFSWSRSSPDSVWSTFATFSLCSALSHGSWEKRFGTNNKDLQLKIYRPSGTHLNCLILYRYSKKMLQTGVSALSLSCSFFH
jgi:hypothetical protein